ncbi:unnamed protein product [Fraxinus pennsylvanica]|uniref:Uncharacterized protein n=1 Tax=Fraxinus pennsylvanica TaxID=56036 RepID=A0AAD1ZYU8_9LAMI|nr:unnamed protein product [Fraxinus pennsylvanica]
MEKSQATNKSKNKILGFLPKAAVSFQDPTFSTGKDKRSDGTNAKKGNTHLNTGSSSPIRSGKSKNSNFDTQEPTSPKISCMGQIKHKKKLCKNKYVSLPKEFEPKIKLIGHPSELKKKPSMVLNMFSSTVKPERRKSDASTDHNKKPPLPDRAPSISQMKRFASSRDSRTLANFDWKTAQIAPEEREYYSEGGEYDVIIPFSAPIVVARSGSGGGGVAVEPRKEINLWKRRTMAQPKPLVLEMMLPIVEESLAPSGRGLGLEQGRRQAEQQRVQIEGVGNRLMGMGWEKERSNRG